jgi:hypothetical protein
MARRDLTNEEIEQMGMDVTLGTVTIAAFCTPMVLRYSGPRMLTNNNVVTGVYLKPSWMRTLATS